MENPSGKKPAGKKPAGKKLARPEPTKGLDQRCEDSGHFNEKRANQAAIVAAFSSARHGRPTDWPSSVARADSFSTESSNSDEAISFSLRSS
jgi:hypothetical protein